MTNELEKQFFDTFGIEPRYKSYFCDGWSRIVEGKYFTDKKEAEKFGMVIGEPKYPQITDRILLELLVIMTRYTDIIDGFDNVQELKEFVLKDLIYSLTQPECNIVKQQVRTLFEEG